VDTDRFSETLAGTPTVLAARPRSDRKATTFSYMGPNDRLSSVLLMRAMRLRR